MRKALLFKVDVDHFTCINCVGKSLGISDCSLHILSSTDLSIENDVINENTETSKLCEVILLEIKCQTITTMGVSVKGINTAMDLMLL